MMRPQDPHGPRLPAPSAAMEPPPGEPQPVVVAGEVLAVVVLGVLAWWCWQRGVIVTVQEGVEVSRIEGRWWVAATAAATLAGLLLLHAGRRTFLAVYPWPRS